MKLRLWLPLVIGAFAAFLGPKLTLPRDRPAGQPFVYEPPEGFIELKDPKAIEKSPDAKMWVIANPSRRSFAPNVSTTHSTQRAPLEERELKATVATMPATLAPEIQWTHRRHETRVRPDGARVGLIEGDCVRSQDGNTEQKFRMLQIVFPDDTGTTIATAQYPGEEATHWEPIFEATIARAKGVAVKVPEVPGWIFAAWGAGGIVLGWLGASLLNRPEEAPAKKEEPEASKRSRRAHTNGNGHANGNGSARRREDEDDDEVDDDESDDDDDEAASKDPKKKDPKADA